MTDSQLYLAVGLPLLAIILDAVVRTMQMSAVNANINARFDGVENRFNGVDNRFTSLEAHFDTMIGKLERH